MASYDMRVDYDTLCTIEDKLQKVEHDLTNSTQKMVEAIQRSQDFLAGHQFEKAKDTTMSCVEISRKTETNLEYAKKYIGDLRMALEEYGRCSYSGEA